MKRVYRDVLQCMGISLIIWRVGKCDGFMVTPKMFGRKIVVLLFVNKINTIVLTTLLLIIISFNKSHF